MVCFDANLLLEVIFARKRSDIVVGYLENIQQPIAISALSGHLVLHFGKKERHISVLRAFLQDFEMLSLEKIDFEWAFNNMRDNDFEDALQVAVAIRNGCTRFVTIDKQLFTNYKALQSIKVELLK